MQTIRNTNVYWFKSGDLIKELNTVKEIEFVNVSTNSKKIEIDFNFLCSEAEKYYDQISENINMSRNQLELILDNYSKKFEGGLYRISLPLLRDHVGCYCGKIFLSKEYFKQGVLLFNRYEGRFNVSILPEHLPILDKIYDEIETIFKSCNMTEETFTSSCPHITNYPGKIGHFCTVCIKAKEKNAFREEKKKRLLSKNMLVKEVI